MTAALGLDFGTASIKAVFTDNEGSMLFSESAPTAPRQADIANTLIAKGFDKTALDRRSIIGVAVTGYGKNLFPGADRYIDEISANALGAFLLSKGKAKTVINIGGQDVKIISVSGSGKTADFKMNDKCAAGTGRFFEMAARILDIPVHDFGVAAKKSDADVSINSTCAVFAETEIVSLLARGVDRNSIIAGTHNAVAGRIADLAKNFSLEEDIYLDGGPAVNEGLLEALKIEIEKDIKVFPHPQFTVAFGAAACLLKDKR